MNNTHIMLFIYFCSDTVFFNIVVHIFYKHISIHRHTNFIHTLIHLQLYFIYMNCIFINGNVYRQWIYRQINMNVCINQCLKSFKPGYNQLQLIVLGILLFFKQLSFTYRPCDNIIDYIRVEYSLVDKCLKHVCAFHLRIKYNGRVANQCSVLWVKI